MLLPGVLIPVLRTEHMTDQRHWFSNFHPADDQCWSVTIADNHVLHVRGVGDVTIHATVRLMVWLITPLLLDNVLYVPHLRRNLISTGRLAEKRVAIIVRVRDECKMISRDAWCGSHYHDRV